MGLPLFSEKRMEQRKRLTGLLPGRLKTSTGLDVSCQPVNVSQNGLGILTDLPLSTGDVVTLFLRDESVDLKVVWIKEDFGRREFKRYGLESSKTESINLESIFIDAGCLV